MERKLNLKRSPHDPRDKKFKSISPLMAERLPLMVDLRPLNQTVFDQLDIGSCVYNTFAKLHDFLRRKELNFKGVFKDSSRLFGYGIGRQMQGTFNEDSGTDLRTGGIVMNKYGTVPESAFPYDHDHLYKVPSDALFAEAKLHTNPTFYACETIDDVRKCLADGYPVAIGFDVPENFMNDEMANTGRMSDSDWRTPSSGLHAVLVMGYNFSDPRNKIFYILNSWNKSWGINGTFEMPEWQMQLAVKFEAWTMRIN